MHSQKIYLVLYALLLISCAQQVAPTGGPEDEQGPRLKKSNPENYSTNFSGDRLELEFNEYVQQNNLFQEMIITPLFEEQPEVKFKGKKVSVIFKEPLKDSTTYNINFGNGIVDFTEQNPMDTATFIFSTGNFLDSMFIQGKVQDAFTLKPAENALVLLYKQFEDSVPKTMRPVYFGRTNENGEYHIGYIKAASYKLFALIDNNSNYLFDLPEETIGFSDTLIDLNKPDTIDIKLFVEDVQKQYVVKAEAPQFGKLFYLLNKPAEKPTIRLLNRTYKTQWYIEDFNTTKDTLTYWLTAIEESDTLEVEFSDGETVLDTTSIIIPTKQPKKGGGRKSKSATAFKLAQTSNVSAGKLGVNDELIITFSHPIAKFEKDSMLLTEGKDTVDFNIEFADEKKRKLVVSYNWKPDSAYQFTISDSSITDIFSLQNDSIGIGFTKRKKEDYGSLKLTVDSAEFDCPFILHLMKDDKLLQEEKVQLHDTATFDLLLPGIYSVKLVYDLNSDGKWTTGKYDEKRQPEKVIYYSGKIDIKANWENAIGWKIGEVVRKK